MLSSQFSLVNLQNNKEEIVPFRENIRMYNVIYELERNWRMYILLEGILILVDKYPVTFINILGIFRKGRKGIRFVGDRFQNCIITMFRKPKNILPMES